ncbi:MAG: DUF2783 domain-containing protein [Oceanicaulis sp.]
MSEPLTPDQADRIFKILTDAQDGLSETDAAAMNARLVLLFAHEIGDCDRLTELCRRANPPGLRAGV